MDFELSVKQLKAMGTHPRVHGNGFIQIDIDSSRRLHFWGHPHIPRQKVATPIHNHVFGFVSEVLMGSLVNLEYSVTTTLRKTPQYHKYQAVGTILEPTGDILYTASIYRAQIVSVGQEYIMHRFAFHETIAREPSVSLIVKTHIAHHTSNPRVLVPKGVEPDNSFDRYGYDESFLWQIIHEVITTGRK